MVKLLSDKDKPSDKADLGVSIYIYTDSGEIKGVWGNSLIGLAELTTEGAWVPVAPNESRVVDLQNYTLYKLDWANENDFYEDGESKALEMYEKGTLTEEYVKENAIFVRNPVTNES
jgi:hypothetical protein